MDSLQQSDAPKPDPATAAFTRLADKVELLEAAVTGLVTTREAVPDYSATLGEMAKRLGAVTQGLGMIADKPAMQLTPEAMAARMDSAAQAARRSDHAALAEARERFDQGARVMREIAGTAHGVREQRRQLAWTAGGGVLAGITCGRSSPAPSRARRPIAGAGPNGSPRGYSMPPRNGKRASG